jgi:hypothetical protein
MGSAPRTSAATPSPDRITAAIRAGAPVVGWTTRSPGRRAAAGTVDDRALGFIFSSEVDTYIMEDIRSLLKEFVVATLAERRRKRKRKPGGPRTDIGALMQINPDAARTKVRVAVKATKGDVEGASEKLGLASRTLYHYLDTDPSLDGVKTTEDYEAAEEREAAAAERRKRDREEREEKEKEERRG